MEFHKLDCKNEYKQTTPVLVLVWFVFFVLFYFIQFSSDNLAGTDGFFHIKFSYLMRTEGNVIAPMDFPWLRYTILNSDEYSDHHILYHVLLTPFTFGDLRIGAKWAAVFFPSLTFFAFYWLLATNRIRYSIFWAAALFAASSQFLFRMSMTRVQSVSLLFMLIGCYFLFNRKYIHLGILGLLYAWLYNGFPFLIVMTVVFTVAHYLTTGERDYKLLLYCCSGALLGLLINPYFLKYPIYIYRSFSHKIVSNYSTPVGGEWYPFDTWQLFTDSTLAFLLLFLGIFLLALKEKRANASTLTLLLISFLFLGLAFKSKRFIEYFPVFALLFSAFSLNNFLEETVSVKEWLKRKLVLYPLSILAITIIGTFTFQNISKVQKDISNESSFDRYSGSAIWLKQNTPPGSTVFTSDWDDFPELFFYNSKNTYTIGLDPAYMLYYDPELYKLWRKITKAKVKDLYQAITENFETEYVFTDNKHKKFIKKALADPRFVEVYKDKLTTIFQIKAPELT